ncbi:amphi-Trp domain-containing protein [Enterococcus olivae]
MRDSNKPVTEVLIDHEEKQTLVTFATTLETIAKKLKDEGHFNFVQGTETIAVTPTEQIVAEYKYEKKGEKHSFEIELEWYEGQKAHKTMSIE